MLRLINSIIYFLLLLWIYIQIIPLMMHLIQFNWYFCLEAMLIWQAEALSSLILCMMWPHTKHSAYCMQTVQEHSKSAHGFKKTATYHCCNLNSFQKIFFICVRYSVVSCGLFFAHFEIIFSYGYIAEHWNWKWKKTHIANKVTIHNSLWCQKWFIYLRVDFMLIWNRVYARDTFMNLLSRRNDSLSPYLSAIFVFNSATLATNKFVLKY